MIMGSATKKVSGVLMNAFINGEDTSKIIHLANKL
nr:MAG TPA: hypothetical protein [Caudoviricetes sp.]